MIELIKYSLVVCVVLEDGKWDMRTLCKYMRVLRGLFRKTGSQNHRKKSKLSKSEFEKQRGVCHWHGYDSGTILAR